MVVDTIKFLLLRPSVSDSTLGMLRSFGWQHGEKTGYFPMPAALSSIHVTSSPLDHITAADIQEGLRKGYRPLMGMRHLARAMQNQIPRYRVIDAALAMELCIKEALIVKCPLIGPLLQAMPSPPLDKLYGDMMEQYMGCKSSLSRSMIRSVAEARNSLIHRHDGDEMSAEDASKYVQIANQAIGDLYAKLYPDWVTAVTRSQMQFSD
ncbi:hypothetical protein GNX71_28570 [Variovorax sp. RKNM96]|uniref:hypothetical protein n=1 Tax=Variovorax sp. RKNM96 TaxID=2681552 RepID=UPI00197CD527|nr:hypothetical protein [Variovorax sp. RKNM96]QSI33308.1 hypothetical protein GNX71_28570 [Variovorax sp. RKNM96]